MIPDFEPNGNLPPSIHHTTWEIFVLRFGLNAHRLELLNGMFLALRNLADAGCQVAYVDGSFVTSKEFPEDYDACWDVKNVDPNQIDPVLLLFAFGRIAQKTKYRGELFPTSMIEGGSGVAFLSFFQTDKRTGKPKGIIALDLRRLP